MGEGVGVIYIDSSCLVKVFQYEAESPAVLNAISVEDCVVISSLAELEVLVHLKADFLAGNLTRPGWRRKEAQFAAMRHQEPFEFRNLSGGVFQVAMRQYRNSGDMHCRSLDRLHLAALEELKMSRLMTHDDRQAKAAAAAGFEVIRPGRD